MKTLQQLRIAKYSNHPANTNGYFDYKYKVKKPTSAAQLEALICEYVTLLGGVCTKVTTAGRQITKKTHVTDVLGRKNSITNTSYIPSTTTLGTSDLIISYGRPSLAIYVEVKFSKGDRLSDVQKTFMNKVIARGAVYKVIKKLPEFE